MQETATSADAGPPARDEDDPLVLLVEDDADLATFIRESLEPTYTVAVARDGREGLALALQLKPDVVLTDIVMPAMRGDGLLRELRSNPDLAETPVIVLTGLADEAQRVRMLREGAQDYLVKPFSLEELRARVDTLAAHRKAVQALRHDEDSWRTLFAQASDGIFIADAEGRYSDVNAAGCAILSRRREEIVGHTIADLLPPFERGRLPAVRQEALGGGRHVREWMMVRGDGSLVAVEVSDCMLSDGRWIGFVRDITERRRRLQAAEELTVELEWHVAERTERLRQLAAELEAAESRERRKIARDLHDDLGQTLAAVRIRLARLCADPRADVSRPAGEIAALVDDAYRATRSLAAQLAPPVLYELGLVPALEWLAEELAASFGLQVEVEDDSSDKPLSQEARAIVYRAVRELLINVAKHAKVGRATVALQRMDHAMRVLVSDAGVGFDAQEQARPSSPGLGLRSVRERLSFIGGRFEIRSVPGDGTVAWLWVPLALPGATEGAS